MFGMGTQEILVILAVALIFIGPKRIPEIARTLGKAFGELRRAADDLKGQIDLQTVMEERNQETHATAPGEDPYGFNEETSPTGNPTSTTPEGLNPTHEQQKETHSEKDKD